MKNSSLLGTGYYLLSFLSPLFTHPQPVKADGRAPRAWFSWKFIPFHCCTALAQGGMLGSFLYSFMILTLLEKCLERIMLPFGAK